jgi:hypothetical protein
LSVKEMGGPEASQGVGVDVTFSFS